MTKPRVAIAFDPDDDVRSAFEEILAPVADLAPLNGLPADERTAALAAAQAVLVRVVHRDLAERDLASIGGKLVQTMIAGVETVPFDKLPEGALIAHNGGAFASQMAEHILAMVLAMGKDLPARHAALQRGEWIQFERTREFKGCTCAILGFGGIGKATGRLMQALGVTVEAINRSGATDEPVACIGTLDDLEQVLGRADVVVLSLGLNAATRGLIDRRSLAWMKEDAILVNVARGAVIAEADLYEHLQRHPKFIACLDAWWGEPFSERVFKSAYPFVDLPNVLGSPHNSAMTPRYFADAARHAAANVRRFLDTGAADRIVTAADRP